MEATKEQLEFELNQTKSALELERRMGQEREVNDGRYARKMIEAIVFTIIGIFALASLYFIFIKAGLPKP